MQVFNKPKQERIALSVLDALEGSTPIPFDDARGARIYIPAASTITELTFYDAASLTDPPLESYDDADTPAAIVLTVAAGRSYLVPAKLYGAGALWLVGDAAGEILVSKKS